MHRSPSRFLVALVLVACADPPQPPSVAKSAVAPSAPVVAPSAPPVAPPPSALAASPLALSVDTSDAGADAHGPTRAPLVRATKWVCEDQDCEGMPTLAYDYLPAVTESGDVVAFVEERDGWGHTAKIGIHLVSGSREIAFLPTVTGDGTQTFADYIKKAATHKAVIDAANADLAKRGLRPLYPLTAAGEEVLVSGRWTKADESEGRKRRSVYTFANVRVVVTEPKNDDIQSRSQVRFEAIAVSVDGREVVKKTGAELPDSAGCSARRMKLDGVRVDSRALALTYTNGETSHACDGKPEPQVHHVIRW